MSAKGRPEREYRSAQHEGSPGSAKGRPEREYRSAQHEGSPESPDDPSAAEARVRFDKWLWAARFYKTRSLAAQAIEAGQARLNAERVKIAHAVRPGDAVSVRKQGVVWDVRVLAVSDRRGSAVEAAKLYAETEESAAARAEEALRRKAAAAADPRFPGRPTKRERRKLEDFLNEP